MKRHLQYITLLAAFLLPASSAFAQLDSRNRTSETIISDGLAQLPAQTTEKYNQVIGEMVSTGTRGIEILAAGLQPAEVAANAPFEYAIDAIVNYTTKSTDAAQRRSIHEGLIKALKASTDNANRAFLLTQLNKLATTEDAELYATLLADEYLHDTAVAGLASMSGNDAIIAAMLADSWQTPDASLAYIAYLRNMKAAEPVLLNWIDTQDPVILKSVYNALATCGTDASLPKMKSRAAAVGYKDDPSGVTDAYLRLLSHVDNEKALTAAAKDLIKRGPSSVRCAGLALLLKADKTNAAKTIVKALKDKDNAYRHTALLNAQDAAGEGIYETVVANYKKYSPEAKADVLAWLGNNHVESQIDFVCQQIAGADPELAKLAIQSAAKIGGDKALEALIAQLGTDNKDAAMQGLLSFNGNINAGILAALDSEDSQTVANALNLASQRHIYEAYDKAIALFGSENAAIKQVAGNNLKGLVRPVKFDQLSVMLANADNDADALVIADAARSAIATLPAGKQYLAISYHLDKGDGSKNVYYFPMLAQAGYGKPVERLLKEYRTGKNSAAALNALLQVDNVEMIDVLYELAVENPSMRDQILNRYVSMVNKKSPVEAEAYRLYSNALALNPSTDVQCYILSSMSSKGSEPALVLVSKYLGNDATSFAAASTVRNIMSKHPELHKGAVNKQIAEKAREVLLAAKAKGDADAGYAADELTGILANFPTDGGYVVVNDTLNGDYENFEMYFDWDASKPATMVLRGMPLITLGADGVMSYAGSDAALKANKGVNNVYVKAINDRVFASLNGTPLVWNAVIVNPVTVNGVTQSAPATGKVAIEAADLAAVNFYFNHLPDTPVFTLSKEEEEQGFEVLFDGRSLEKWHGNTTAYVPVDGNIYVTAEYGGSGNLYTKKNYSDFIYRFEFFYDVPAVNNGIGIRTGKDVTGVDAAFWGMEIQVLDHDDPIYQGHNFGYKGIQPYQNHGCIYGVVAAKHFPSGPIKKWHTEEIKAIGDHITVTIDGDVILDANIREACQGHAVDPNGGTENPYMIDHRNHPGLFNKEGYISFCGHGAGVAFRNVRILDLSPEAVAARNKSKRQSK